MGLLAVQFYPLFGSLASLWSFVAIDAPFKPAVSIAIQETP